MRVVVTGGGGYVGSILVPELLKRGHQVCVFDRFVFGREPIRAVAKSPDCEIIAGDIRRLQDFPELLKDTEAIIHLAGLSNDPSCDLDPQMTLDVNVDATRALAAQAVEQGVRRFVLASSCSVYGQGVFDVLDEESPTNPVSAYASSKVEGEQALLELKSARFQPVISRAATIFGWSPRMRFDLAVNLMTATAVRNGLINVLGGGRQWRPFVHVRDVARLFADFLEAPAELVSGEIFNVGSDDLNLQIIDLGKRVCEAIPGTDLKVSADDEDRRTYRVQFQKLKEQLGFECEYSFEDGIEEVRHYLEDETIDPFSEPFNNVRRLKRLLATLVEEGGEPIAPRFIPLAKPLLGEEEERAVLEAMRSGWVTSGPQIAAFEKELGETINAEHVVAVTACTSALHLCMAHQNIGPEDEVILSPLTWPSVGNLVLNMGAKVVFADIDGATLNVDPASIEAAITERTKAIIPVHMAGQPCDLDAIYAIGRKFGVPIIEDAAHALGASYKGAPIGSRGDFACFSFYAIKNITTFEGGAIALQDPEVAGRLRRLANHGLGETAWDRYSESAVPAPYEIVEPGYKYSMGNVSAAIGLEQLKKFSRFQAVRKRLAGLYRHALGDIEEVWLPEVNDPAGHGWHLMIVRFHLDKLSIDRDRIAHALRQENIGSGFHFYGLHLHEYYRDQLGFRPEDLPEATAASHEVLSLPLYPGMTDKNINEVVAALKKVLHAARVTTVPVLKTSSEN
ncbi:MAG: aminotransferase class I/II-fold pyridoxal phosphate-dependent enzyme [Candidatus Hydrogenedentes bacterium]|nr:aminotransferase class I/II-fold pyridoxal phosphate-dependent enzyme [Candidatus Hydrogenedentota bacterium]